MELNEFYLYQDITKICEDLDVPYVEDFCLYIKECIEHKIPIILYSQTQVNIAKELINAHTLNDEIPIEVDEQENVDVCCKHYPYTCDEVTYSQNLLKTNDIYGSHRKTSMYSCCECRGECACDGTRMRHFLPFSWNNCYMKHRDNCYDDCCSHSIVFKRFVISLFDSLKNKEKKE